MRRFECNNCGNILTINNNPYPELCVCGEKHNFKFISCDCDLCKKANNLSGINDD